MPDNLPHPPAGTNPKTTLYVGGLEESVNESHLHAAFIPFGDIKDVNIPLDHANGKHRGFGFVEYEEKDDAQAAMDNMNNAELYGRVLRVNFAQPQRISERGVGRGGRRMAACMAAWVRWPAWLHGRGSAFPAPLAVLGRQGPGKADAALSFVRHCPLW